MDLRTALGVEHKRRATEEEVEAALKAATEAEATLAESDEVEIRPTARARFYKLGERIIAMADYKVSIKVRNDYAGDKHTGTTEIGTEGIAVVAQAREGYTPGSLRGRELNYINVEWLSSGYVADTPFARQELGSSEVQPHIATPETYGMLRLMEQSLDVVELARQGADVSHAPEQ